MRLRLPALLSLLTHALLLLLILLLRPQPEFSDDVSRGQTVSVVFEGGQKQTDTAPAPPKPSAQAEPRVNVFGEDTLLPPPPDSGTQPLMRRAPPQPARQRAAPQKSGNPFASLQNFSFEGAAAQSQAASPARGLSLSLAPVIRGGRMLDPVTHVASSTASADWRRSVEDWIEQHKYYPRAAAENGEDGTATVVARIDRNGRVLSVRVAGSSGSRWLDLATLAIFRGQTLPPFPDDMPDKDVEVTLDMNYILVRR